MRSRSFLPVLLLAASFFTLCFVQPSVPPGSERWRPNRQSATVVSRHAAPPRPTSTVVYYKALTKINVRISPEAGLQCEREDVEKETERAEFGLNLKHAVVRK